MPMLGFRGLAATERRAGLPPVAICSRTTCAHSDSPARHVRRVRAHLCPCREHRLAVTAPLRTRCSLAPPPVLAGGRGGRAETFAGPWVIVQPVVRGRRLLSHSRPRTHPCSRGSGS